MPHKKMKKENKDVLNVLIFCNTRKGVQQCHGCLRRNGFENSIWIHAGIFRNMQTDRIKRFITGKFNLF